MTDIRFYHLRTRTLEQALPDLLTKALALGRRVLVRLPDAALAGRLNDSLWTYRLDSFLPHGMKGDGHEADQPVWLTDDLENPNGADVLILAAGAAAPDVGTFKLACDMLDGNDEAAVTTARQRWKDYGAAGHIVTYWQQTDKGGWEQKA